MVSRSQTKTTHHPGLEQGSNGLTDLTPGKTWGRDARHVVHSMTIPRVIYRNLPQRYDIVVGTRHPLRLGPSLGAKRF